MESYQQHLCQLSPAYLNLLQAPAGAKVWSVTTVVLPKDPAIFLTAVFSDRHELHVGEAVIEKKSITVCDLHIHPGRIER